MTDYADHGQRIADLDWSTAYQCCDRSTCFTSLRSSFPSWWWDSQHWLFTWFLWYEITEKGKVTFTDQYWFFCSYSPILSKDCCDKPLASSSSEWAYSQDDHLLYAIVMQTPFCLCKHILYTMLEVRNEKNTSLSFGCLITQICLQVVIDISNSEPKSQILDPLCIQTHEV
jgi:hypothetical protein